MRGDFKSGRVKNPTAPISSKHEKTVKNFVKDYMDKAVKKKTEREKEKATRDGSKAAAKTVEENTPETPRGEPNAEKAESEDEMIGLSDNEDTESHEVSPADSSATDLKRKREGDGDPGSPKKSRIEMVSPAPPPPPPPPPPPTEDMPLDIDGSTLTPMEDDDQASFHLAGEDVNGVAVNGKSKLPQDDVTQLATPPTNGSCEHNEYPHGNHDGKRPVTVEGGS